MIREERSCHQVARLKIRAAADVTIRRGAPALVVHYDEGAGPESVITEFHGDTLTIEDDGPAATTVIRDKQGRVVITNTGSHAKIAGGDFYEGGVRSAVHASGGSIAAGGDVHIGGTWGGRQRNVVAGGDVYIDGRRVETTGPTTVVSRQTPRIDITMPVIPDADMVASGSVMIEDADQPALSITLSGIGDVEASGKVDQLAAELSGSGSMDMRALHTNDVSIELSGSGNVRVHAAKSTDIRLSGSGNVTVYGSPDRRRDRVRGSGDVMYRD